MPVIPPAYPLVHQLPPDPSLPDNPDAQTLVRSLNKHGAYIHKIRHATQNALSKLNKIAERQIPTPASLVGVGISRTYNQSNVRFDEMSTGLVFATHTPVAVAHKNDFGSYRLQGQTPYTQSARSEGAALTQSECDALSTYARQLASALPVTCNMTALANKMREIEIRANLSELRSPNATALRATRDYSSKYLVRALINLKGGNVSQTWTSDTLLSFLDEHTQEFPVLKAQLEHAIPKIRAMESNPGLLNEWLNKPYKPTANRYAQDYKTHGTIKAPSECLTLPRTEDIVGVAVEIAYPGSVDKAFHVRSLLSQDKPPLMQCISEKQGSTLIELDWDRDLLPLSTSGMQQFLTSGNVMRAYGVSETPDFFSAMHNCPKAVHPSITDKTLTKHQMNVLSLRGRDSHSRAVLSGVLANP